MAKYLNEHWKEQFWHKPYDADQYNKDMVTLQNQENEAYANLVKGYSSLTSPTEPSLIGTGLQIVSAGVNYQTENLKRQGKWYKT